MTSRDYVFTIYGIEGYTVIWDTDPFAAHLCNMGSLEHDKGSSTSDIPSLDSKCTIKYVCYQLELCPTTKRAHIQGYVQLRNSVRYAGCQSALGWDNAHVERKQGTIDQAISYTKKEESKIGTWFEHGSKPLGRGKRSDLDRLSEDIHAGSGLRDIALNSTAAFIRYHRGIAAAINLLTPAPSREKIKVFVLFGATGTGKSRWCHEHFPDAYWWPKSANGADYALGYDGRKRVTVLDDFHGGMRFTTLLRVLDRYPLYLNTQGNNAPYCGDLILITTNYPVSEWYTYKDALSGRILRSLPALERRITNTVVFPLEEGVQPILMSSMKEWDPVIPGLG